MRCEAELLGVCTSIGFTGFTVVAVRCRFRGTHLTLNPAYLPSRLLACAQVTEKFKDRLVDEGFNPAYGARPLRRAIMRLIEDCLAERILVGDIKEGDVVIMDVDPDGAIAVLAGDKKMRQVLDATPAGIS